MATNKSPFDILGVNRFSTQKEIRRRYLALCKKHHPDVAILNNKHARSVVDFTEITVAYQQLIYPEKYHANATVNTGVRWEEARQKAIDTKIWTRNSYFIGFGIALGMIAYLSWDRLTTLDKKRTLLPHERKRQI